MKTLYIDHGNPMNAISDTEFTRTIKNIGQTLQNIKRIIIISAHWLTRGDTIEIGTNLSPEMIYDIYGFPEELYRVQYPAKIDRDYAYILGSILGKNSIKYVYNENRGIDHGIWSILIHLFPDAHIPIIPISVSYDQSARFHYQLGQILGSRMDDDTIFLSSGNIVHNLHQIDWSGGPPPQWASDFDTTVASLISAKTYDSLIEYLTLPGAHESVPTPDHFFPFLSFLGASTGSDIVSTYGGFELGSISTRIYKNF